ncbi:DUF5819 family protein [Aeromicrobium sp. A1-2]|uniref:DUF5819 family protein n=1 Tax=Aeromicrobium sp. A1-2 TaxID=2107713 RepID=UPI0013C2DD88|nr:DUF5819 family protein [Aeromicrobium sp. A1-2]
MDSEPGTPVPSRPWQRWSILSLAVLAAVHSVVLMLWLAPSSPLRDAVGSSNLASYVDPYFQQGDNGVGIGAQFVDESFSIRALIRPEGAKKTTLTTWVDVTAVERRSTVHDLDPARVHATARRLATNLNLAMFNLEPEQRKLIRSVKALDGVTKVRAALTKNGANARSITSFLAYDQMATQFASLYARSLYDGDQVVQVQYRVGRRTVPPFADRDKKTLADVDYRIFYFGWRLPFRGSTEARAAFDSYVKK